MRKCHSINSISHNYTQLYFVKVPFAYSSIVVFFRVFELFNKVQVQHSTTDYLVSIELSGLQDVTRCYKYFMLGERPDPHPSQDGPRHTVSQTLREAPPSPQGQASTSPWVGQATSSATSSLHGFYVTFT